jgi:hypothetical protein
MKKLGICACAVLALAVLSGCGSPTSPVTKLSTLSGTWTGSAVVTSGTCPGTNGPWPETMTWIVSDSGDVTIQDAFGSGGTWKGTMTQDLKVSLQRTASVLCGFPTEVVTTHVATYSGEVISGTGYSASIAGLEVPCNDCSYTLAWSMTHP